MASFFDELQTVIGTPVALEFHGVSASTSREEETITQTVIIDMQEVKTHDKKGLEISRNWVVLLVPASQYDFGSGLVKPSIIDEFTVESRKYEPREPDGIGRCWDYTDGTSQMFKVYVEEVSP